MSERHCGDISLARRLIGFQPAVITEAYLARRSDGTCRGYAMRLYVPYTDEREAAEVAKVLATGYLTQGPKVAEFEGLISAMIGSRHAFAMSSCTTALHLALVALGIGAGDDVLVSGLYFPGDGQCGGPARCTPACWSTCHATPIIWMCLTWSGD